MTLKECKVTLANLGFAMRKVDGELIVYPIGTSKDRAYFPGDYQEALDTARAIIAHGIL
jgi:hypothetical protein